MLTELKKSFTNEVKEGMAMVHQIKNTNKETDILRKNQMEIMELKRMITEMKNSVEASTVDLNLQKKESARLVKNSARFRRQINRDYVS